MNKTAAKKKKAKERLGSQLTTKNIIDTLLAGAKFFLILLQNYWSIKSVIGFLICVLNGFVY